MTEWKWLCHLAAAPPGPTVAGPPPGSLPQACLLARASVLAAPACLRLHGMETESNRALSVFLPHRFTSSQAVQGTTQQCPAFCRDSSQQEESKFNSAIPCKVLWTPPELEELMLA